MNVTQLIEKLQKVKDPDNVLVVTPGSDHYYDEVRWVGAIPAEKWDHGDFYGEYDSRADYSTNPSIEIVDVLVIGDL